MTLSSHAQAMKITGNVSDANGPLPGTIIVVKGSKKGTKTDFDGNFYIYAKKGESLVFSYLGFRTKTIKIKSNEKQLGRVNTNCIENQCDIDKGGEHNVKFVEP